MYRLLPTPRHPSPTRCAQSLSITLMYIAGTPPIDLYLITLVLNNMSAVSRLTPGAVSFAYCRKPLVGARLLFCSRSQILLSNFFSQISAADRRSISQDKWPYTMLQVALSYNQPARAYTEVNLADSPPKFGTPRRAVTIRIGGLAFETTHGISLRPRSGGGDHPGKLSVAVPAPYATRYRREPFAPLHAA